VGLVGEFGGQADRGWQTGRVHGYRSGSLNMRQAPGVSNLNLADLLEGSLLGHCAKKWGEERLEENKEGIERIARNGVFASRQRSF